MVPGARRAMLAGLLGGLVSAELVAAAPSEQTCDADSSSLLQTRARARELQPNVFVWKTAPANQWIGSCTDICQAHNMVCEPKGFEGVTDAASLQSAITMATGAPCPEGSTGPAWFGYGAPSRMQSAACFYPVNKSQQSACSDVPFVQMTTRYCPCVSVPPPMIEVWHSGIYCQEQPDLACNCTWANPDNFQENTRCAKACRGKSGFRESPPGFASWMAPRNWSPRDVPGCNCRWMLGWGDDCQSCDYCAAQCRRANPEGTCGGAW